MPFSFAAFFAGLASAGRPNVISAAEPVANGTDQGDVIADAGAGAVFAGDGNDLYVGGDTASLVDGAGGSDLLYGGGGSDTLIGAAGDDGLVGGAGADIFVFGLGPGGVGAEAGADRVFDFAVGEDRADLSGRGLSFADLQIQEVQSDIPGAGIGTLVTYAGGSVEFVNVAPQAITADAFVGLIG